MNHKDILKECERILEERGGSYGGEDFLFNLIAQMATLITGRKHSKYDVSVVLECVKLARRRVNLGLDDNFIDQINYTAFSAQFAAEEAEERRAALARREQELANEEISNRVDADLSALVSESWRRRYGD